MQQGHGYIFDTHALIKNLIAAKFSEEQAEVLVRTISDVRKDNDVIEKKIDNFESEKDSLATKADIAELRASTKADIAELKNDINELRVSTKGDIKDLKSEIKDIKKDTEIALKCQEIRLIKWMFGMLVTQLGLMMLILKVFFNGTSSL